MLDDFAKFMRLNEVKHVRGAPYHPATNGLVERFVQTLKSALKARVNSGLSLQHRLLKFLFNYRSTQHATTGVSPASLFLHRTIRTRLHPNDHSNVLARQSEQKGASGHASSRRDFFVGQSVMARDLRPGPDWVPAVIVECLGPVVATSDQLLWKRHVDLLRELCVRNRLCPTENSNSDEHGDIAESPDSESSPPTTVLVPELPAPNVVHNTVPQHKP